MRTAEKCIVGRRTEGGKLRRDDSDPSSVERGCPSGWFRGQRRALRPSVVGRGGSVSGSKEMNEELEEEEKKVEKGMSTASSSSSPSKDHT